MKFLCKTYNLILSFLLAVFVAFYGNVQAVLAQDPTPTPAVEPYEVTIEGGINVLTDLGLFPVLAVVAVLFLATLVYRRFKK